MLPHCLHSGIVSGFVCREVQEKSYSVVKKALKLVVGIPSRTTGAALVEGTNATLGAVRTGNLF